MCHFLMYFSFDGKDKGSFYISTWKFIRFPLKLYTFYLTARLFWPKYPNKRTIFHLSILIYHWSTP